ncbi:MAG: glycosyltransferase [Candidatus Ratteibacteria bacterium]|jgi:glycosyltransferase involved in cell wall biosynthesis
MDKTDKKVDISVIVCVYAGGEFFKKNIESVSRLKIPDNTRVEFLFIDNNSTDGNGEIIKEYARTYPDTFRYLLEPKPGKSYALNLGIKEARGEILAFTDADIILPEDWLLLVKEGFEKHNCAALGGRVLPVWEKKPSAWFTRETNNGKRCGMFGLFDGEKAGYYPPGKGPDFPSGGNSAVKREIFLKYGGFRTELGPKPGLHIGGEDDEFFCRVHLAGEKIFYHPPMTVYHQISQNRLTKRYLLQNGFFCHLDSLYIASLYPGTEKNKTRKELLALPETLGKFILSGFNAKLTTHSNFRYRVKLRNVFCGLSYRLLGFNRTIKLFKFVKYI